MRVAHRRGARRQLRDAGPARDETRHARTDPRRYGVREAQREPVGVGGLSTSRHDGDHDRVRLRAPRRARAALHERRAGRRHARLAVLEVAVRPPRDRRAAQGRSEEKKREARERARRKFTPARPRGARLNLREVASSGDDPTVDHADGRHLAGARAPAEAASAPRATTNVGWELRQKQSSRCSASAARARAMCKRGPRAARLRRGADHRFDDATLVRRLPRQRTACVATRRPRRSHLLARANAGRRAVRGELLTLPSTTRRSRSSCYRAARAPAAPRAAERGPPRRSLRRRRAAPHPGAAAAAPPRRPGTAPAARRAA